MASRTGREAIVNPVDEENTEIQRRKLCTNNYTLISQGFSAVGFEDGMGTYRCHGLPWG